MSLFGNQNFIKDAIATAFGGNPLKLEGDMSFLWAILHLKGEPGGLGSQGTASGKALRSEKAPWIQFLN